MELHFGTNVLGFPLLSFLTYFPLVGAIVLLFVNREKVNFIKWFAFVIALIDFVVSIIIWFKFDRSTWHFQFVERFVWIRKLGVEYYFGIDGISVLLVLLTTFLSAISVLCSFNYIQEREKEYYIALLVLETGMLGVFCALDMFLFYVSGKLCWFQCISSLVSGAVQGNSMQLLSSSCIHFSVLYLCWWLLSLCISSTIARQVNGASTM